MPSILEEAIGRSHPCQEKARRNVWSHPTTKKGCRCWKALNIFYFCSIEKRSLPVLKKRLILSFNHRLRSQSDIKVDAVFSVSIEGRY